MDDTLSPVPDDARDDAPVALPDGQVSGQVTGQDGAADGGTGQRSADRDRVVVVTPQGMSVTTDTSEEGLAGMVEQPAKVMRIGSMVKQLLEEVRTAPLDEAGRARLADVHARSIAELESGLADDLVAELRRIALPFSPGSTPSESELRIAQAQLVGWLEGLFHGIQTTLFAQQMAARAQLEQIRRQALPAAPVPAPGHEGPPTATGQYL
ncbi:bacterial proteasome activator family protein [Aquipuribacter hungaricus]|uniref:Bacterial proteasome activator n=1 Tax=Aquipuribacter hungaricus TaxID=545624 RepID=A0ABV7WMI6_9MICO